MARTPLPEYKELSLKVYQFLLRRPSTSRELVSALGIDPPQKISSILRRLNDKGYIDVVAQIGAGKNAQRVWGANHGYENKINPELKQIQHYKLKPEEFDNLRENVLQILFKNPDELFDSEDLQRVLGEQGQKHSRYNIAAALVSLSKAGHTEQFNLPHKRYSTHKWKPRHKPAPTEIRPKAPNNLPPPISPQSISKTPKPTAPVQQGKPFPCGLETGQKVNTPMGQGRLTSQQGDRLIVKFANKQRYAFPISEISA